MNRTGLEGLARAWERHARERMVFEAVSAGAAGFAVAARWSVTAGFVLAGVTAIATVVVRVRSHVRVTVERVAEHLNGLFPDVEASAALWLRAPETLSLIERLQLKRLNAAWTLLERRSEALLALPARRKRVGVGALALVMVLGAAVSWQLQGERHGDRSASTDPEFPPATGARESAPAQLVSTRVRVAPPAYLHRVEREVTSLDTDVEEGATVSWELSVRGPIQAVRLRTVSGGPDQGDAPVDETGRAVVSRVISSPWLYQVELVRSDGEVATLPGIHVLKVIPDLPPRVVFESPVATRTVVDPGQAARVDARVSVSDDHGIGVVSLIATVAKGTGEGVKFREQVLSFDTKSRDGSSGVFTRELDLTALGLEPGDELYVYAQASDTREPVAQVSRSETRFIVLRGLATELSAEGSAVAGVNRLPQYFRSQRQLIIDTERLLAEKATLAPDVFQRRSEDIGIDQKLLRLRYGQFLGEEFEAEPGAARVGKGGVVVAPVREEEDRQAPAQRMIKLRQDLSHAGHDHVGGETPHDRETGPATVEQLSAAYLHDHDKADVATLFDLEIKASLRGVLAAMWEAEGLLRTIRPEEALAPENRALERLKEMQQADRMYVRRVGFEPSPIKIDERRLKGELDAIPLQTVGEISVPRSDGNRRRAASAMEHVTVQPSIELPAEERSLLEAVFVAAAPSSPESFIPVIAAWRKPAASRSTEENQTILQGLWSLMGEATAVPSRPAQTTSALGARFRAILTDETKAIQ